MALFGDAGFRRVRDSGIQVEKGEAELEYRGAVHWGFPKAEREEAEEDGDEEGALEEEEEGEFLRQSHDFEVQYGITERMMLSTTLGTDEPLDQNFDLSSSMELQYEMVERKGNGLGLAFTVDTGLPRAAARPTKSSWTDRRAGQRQLAAHA